MCFKQTYYRVLLEKDLKGFKCFIYGHGVWKPWFFFNLFYENPSLASGRRVTLFEGPFCDEVSEYLWSCSFNDDLACVLSKDFWNTVFRFF